MGCFIIKRIIILTITLKTNADEHPFSSALKTMTAEEIWMATVDIQVQRELEIYRELFDFLLFDVSQIDQPVIIEGAACLPELVLPFTQLGHKAVWIIPTETFQRQEYAKRTWAASFVKGCSDPKLAFEHWMQRDAAFAKLVNKQAVDLRLPSLVVDGSRSIAENAAWTAEQLGLE